MSKRISHSYFVVMQDLPLSGMEAVVQPEITRREVVSRIRSREYDPERIVFIHHIDGHYLEDQTAELIEAAQMEDA